MHTHLQDTLRPLHRGGGLVSKDSRGVWKLEIPAGSGDMYRLAQIDDYHSLARADFPWQTGTELRLQARASSPQIPGTWGFGLWNDPFSLSIGLGGGTRRVPSLPNAAWFFFASPPNYLSLRDDLPARGALVATFRSPSWSAAALAPLGFLLPMLIIPPLARLARRLGRRIIAQDAEIIEIDPTAWHDFGLQWQENQVVFMLDGKTLLTTPIVPEASLGLVLWIDNQYAALPPDGRLKYGSLPASEPAWIELKNVVCA